MIKKIVAAVYLLTIPLLVSAQTIKELKEKTDSYLKSKTLIHGQSSFYAEYTDTGEEILNINGDESLAPASCQKLYTSSAALAGLGEDFRFKTKLYYDGDIDPAGNLNGNIYIVGDGDPTLGSDQVKGSLRLDSLMNVWTGLIKGKGIKSISGKIYANDLKYDLYTVPDDWSWTDIGNYYGAGTTALCINDNLYHLYFKPGKDVGSPAEVLRTVPEIKWLSFIDLMKTGKEGSGDNGYIFCAPLQKTAVLKGTIPAGVSEFPIKGSIPDPPYFAAYYFAETLINNGIIFRNMMDPVQIAGKLDKPVSYDSSKMITSLFSPPLKDIVYIINKRSNNLYTEQVLKALAFYKKNEGSTDKGIETLYDFLKQSNVPTGGVYFHDGCGLSRFNGITAKSLAKLLSFNTKQSYFRSFYYSMGIAGDPDDISSFKNYGKNTIIAKNARIKDGLIGHVRSHSGYVTSRSGRLISFSFIANNYEGSARTINEMHTELIIKLAELL